jgi:transcription termination factor Rho
MSESTPSPSENAPKAKAPAKKAAAKKVAAIITEKPVSAVKKAAKKAAKKVAIPEASATATEKKTAVKKAAAAKVSKEGKPESKKSDPAKENVTTAKIVTVDKAQTAEPRVAAVPSSVVEPRAAVAHEPVSQPFPIPSSPPQQQQPQHANQQQRPPFEQKQNKHNKNNKFGNGKKNRFDRNQNHQQKNRPFGKPQQQGKPDPDADRGQAVLEGPKVEVTGLLELTVKGSGFIRSVKKSYEIARDDAFITAQLVNRFGLRPGVILKVLTQLGTRGPQVVEIISVNDAAPDEARRLPHFEELTAINPAKRIPFENDQNRFTTRVLDIVAPVGRGQRGLIVSPPRSGKTTLLLHIAESIRSKEDDNLHLIVLLVDERPEEVTEFKRALPGAEIIASSNDENPRNHCRIAELTIERAKRLVEAGKHVFLLMDSITRLARAYNNTSQSQGRGIGTGGVTVGALEVPRRLFAAARNTRGGGSLTILATALIQTNSRADEAIFQEFKGTGNMEIVLDRKIAENYIYPAVDIFKSGTRREELLLPEHMLHKIHLIRRGLSGHKPLEAMERLTYFLKKFPSNAQMLLEIKG